MQPKTATLFLLKSKNPPVFRQGSEIYYRRAPKIGESFLFSQKGLHYCNFSEVKKIVKLEDLLIVKTRNSVYAIRKESDEPIPVERAI